MLLPIEKEHPMQILGRIGPTVSLESGDLNFGLRQPRRSDLTSSGPTFWRASNNVNLGNFLIEALLLPKKGTFHPSVARFAH